MRFGLIDLLIVIFFTTVGTLAGHLLGHFFPAYLYLTLLTVPICTIGLYLAVVAPIYRRFRLFPLILPRCPCCSKFQHGYHFTRGWPRVAYRCPTCKGEFVIWHNGEPGDNETWERPVLALKWPYAWGWYKRMDEPKSMAPNSENGSALR